MEVKPMDKLAKQLKADAAALDVQVSDELDRRINASLQGVSPEKPATSAVQQRPPLFWWASSLTGIAAALAVIAIINSYSQAGVEPVPQIAETSPVIEAVTPIIHWNTESAMLTRPLQRELEDLQSDIKKAEEKLKREIGL
jgi:hypothetical protein